MIGAFGSFALGASALDDEALAVIVALAATPVQDPDFDTNSVSPGVAGFLITFGVAVVVVLLMVDMVRRVRRTRYREDIRAQLEEERLASGESAGTTSSESAGDASGSTDPAEERPPGA